MNDLIIIKNIQDKIYEIRGQRVMLDRDIAAFYGVEPKRLNEKVKRNPKRFAGEDFMFQLTAEELDDLRLRSQIATIKKGRGSHTKYLPHVLLRRDGSFVMQMQTRLSITIFPKWRKWSQ